MNEQIESVIVIDPDDVPVGISSKLDAHRTGALHRAFSVFVTDAGDRVLLQRRAHDKYHSGGLWTNACCGHPRPSELTKDAAERRLKEEMGIDCDLIETGSFVYRAAVGNDLIEHELDHVFVGRFSGTPSPDPAEVQDWRWVSVDSLEEWVTRDRAIFTAWFTDALEAAGLGTIRSSTFADDSTPGTPPPG